MDLDALIRARRGLVATLGLYRVPNPRSNGLVELDTNGLVVGFVEKPERPASDLAWAGLLVAAPALLDAIPGSVPRDLGFDILPRLLGRMRGIVVDGYHRDIGTPESYRQANSDFERMESAT